MKIETKFALGDKVWTLSGLKTIEFEICSISINKSPFQPDQPRITYCGEYKDGKITTAAESESFATKEELIKYICDDGADNPQPQQ